MAKRYIVANNTGKGFITHEHRNQFAVQGFPLDIWVIGREDDEDNPITQQEEDDLNLWVAAVSGTVRTKAQAQSLLDAADFEDEDGNPVTVTLP